MSRDLDAEIAETIYGWKPVRIGKDYNGENDCEVLAAGGILPKGFHFPNIGNIHRGYLAPQYSGVLDSALHLAIKIIPEISIGELGLNPENIAKKCLEVWKLNNPAPHKEEA